MIRRMLWGNEHEKMKNRPLLPSIYPPTYMSRNLPFHLPFHLNVNINVNVLVEIGPGVSLQVACRDARMLHCSLMHGHAGEAIHLLRCQM